MTRNEAREILMQIMYEMDITKSIDHQTAENLARKRLEEKHLTRCMRILDGIVEHIDEIDGDINAHSHSWSTSRMSRVDLAIIRLAIGEILYGEDVPVPVAVNEAINMAKKFSTERSSRFVHGVLGSVIND